MPFAQSYYGHGCSLLCPWAYDLWLGICLLFVVIGLQREGLSLQAMFKLVFIFSLLLISSELRQNLKQQALKIVVYIFTQLYQRKNISCTGAQYHTGNIQLVGGSYPWEGRVEIYLSGAWGTITDSPWSSNDAQTVCQTLGYFKPGTCKSKLYSV